MQDRTRQNERSRSSGCRPWPATARCVAFVFFIIRAYAQIVVSTLAGGGSTNGVTAGRADGVGTAAMFTLPAGVAVDLVGANLYVADWSNNVIRRILVPSGTVSTLAGGGTIGGTAGGYANGVGVLATFYRPYGVAVDPAGVTLYVADSQNSLIRQVNISSGSVSTLAGGGVSGTTSGSADGIGTSATFNSPNGVAVDVSGNTLYVADYANHLIRQVVLAGGGVSTLAGGGSVGGVSPGAANGVGTAATFRFPMGVAVDPIGTYLFVADYQNSLVRQIVITSGAVATLAGGLGGTISGHTDGFGTLALFMQPIALAVDGAGANLYVSDFANNLIRQVAISSGTVTTVAGGNGGTANGHADGIGTAATLNNPWGISVGPSGAVLYVGDQQNNLIRQIALPLPSASPTASAVPTQLPFGTVTTLLGGGSVGGSAAGHMDATGTAALFSTPRSTAVDPTSSLLYVTDTSNLCVREASIPTGIVSTLAGGSSGSVDGIGVAATFSFPRHAAVDGSGNVYVTDQTNCLVRKIVSSTRAVTRLAGGGCTGCIGSGHLDGVGTAAMFNSPVGIAVNVVGMVLYVGDSSNNLIRAIAIGTASVTTLAGGGCVYCTNSGSSDGTGTSATFNLPCGVAFNGAGMLYVADNVNNRIRQVFVATGAVTTLAGGASGGYVDGVGTLTMFSNPTGVAADSCGNVYVADGNTVVRRIYVSSAAVSSVAGNPTAGRADGVGAAALFGSLDGISVDVSGDNIYVADGGNNLVRRISVSQAGCLPPSPSPSASTALPFGTVTTLAGGGSPGGSASGHSDGVATAALFGGPNSVTVDVASGAVFVADTDNNLIRKVLIGSSAVVTTFAGGGSAGGTAAGTADGTAFYAMFGAPTGVTADGQGNLFVADNINNLIRQIVISTAVVTTLAGGGGCGFTDGTGTAAMFCYPQSVAAAAGMVFVADNEYNIIRQVVVSTHTVSTLAGFKSITGGHADGVGTGATFDGPKGIAVDSGATTLFVTDGINNLVRQLHIGSNLVTTLAGGGAAGSTLSGHADGIGVTATFNNPGSLTVDATSTFLYVADNGNNLVRMVALGTATVTTIAGGGNAGGTACGQADGTGTGATLCNPAGVAVDVTGSILYVADFSYNLIRQVSLALVSASATPVASISLPPFLSLSVSLSASISQSMSPSIFASVTGTATSLSSPGASASITGSVSASSSRTALGSSTASASVSSSFTLSLTASVTASVSLSVSVSVSAVFSLSVLPSGSSLSSSISQGTSPSISASVTGTATSLSSPGASASITGSISTSSSQTALSSTTASASASSSFTMSLTASVTASLSVSGSGSCSGSGSLSASATASGSISASATASSTATSTASGSPAAFALRFVAAPGATIELATLSLAPWLPPIAFSLQVRGCPVPGATLAIDCGVVGGGKELPAQVALQWADAPPPTVLAAAMLTGAALGDPSAAATAPCPSVSSSWADVVPMQALQLLLLPASAGGNGTTLSQQKQQVSAAGTVLRCAASLVGTALPVPPVTASGLAVSVASAAAWPAVADVVTLRAGELLQTSIGGGLAWNLTGYAATSLAVAAAASTGSSGAVLDAATASILPLALRAARSTSAAWASLDDVVLHYWTAVLGRPPPSSAAASVAAAAAGGTFSVIVSDASTVVIVADVQRAGVAAGAAVGPFSNVTAVSLGGVPLPVLHVSPDGTLLVTVTPPLCSASGSGQQQECGGYYTLTLSNPVGNGASLLTLSCPPACGAAAYAGAMPYTTTASSSSVGAPLAYFPSPASVLNGSIVLAALPAGPTLVTPPALASVGVYYTSVCAGFTDPTSGACNNASAPGFSNCAFGTGAGCVPCPAYALCPGGPRAWPLPGFYTPYEASGAILSCAPPSARCRGWDSSAGVVACGTGYLTGSIGCAACAAHFYASASGECIACPTAASPWDAAWPLLVMAAGLVAACAVVYGLLVALARCTGGTVEGGAVRLLHLLAWVVAMAQMIGQISSAAVAGSPASLRTLYAGIAVFQLSGIVIPSACLFNAPPFAMDVASCLAPMLLATVVLPSVVLVGLRAKPKRLSASAAVAVVVGGETRQAQRAFCAALWPHLTAPNALRVLWPMLVLLYSRTASISMGLLQCSTQTLPLAAAVALNGGSGMYGTAAAAAALDGTEATLLVSVRVLDSNPSFICFTGAHLGPAAIAALTIALYLVAFPVAALGAVALHVPRVRRTMPCCCACSVAAAAAAATSAGSSSRREWCSLQRRKPVAATPSKASGSGDIHIDLDSAVSLGLLVDKRPADGLLFVALTHNYRPRAFWVETADLAVLAALAAVNSCWQGTDPTTAIARAAVSAVLAVSLAIVVYIVLPYPAEQRWKTPVRVYALLLAALCGVVNGVASVAALQQDTGSSSSSSGGSGATAAAVLVLLIAAAGFCAVLVCAFGYGMIRGAREEGQSRLLASLSRVRKRINSTVQRLAAVAAVSAEKRVPKHQSNTFSHPPTPIAGQQLELLKQGQQQKGSTTSAAQIGVLGAYRSGRRHTLAFAAHTSSSALEVSSPSPSPSPTATEDASVADAAAIDVVSSRRLEEPGAVLIVAAGDDAWDEDGDTAAKDAAAVRDDAWDADSDADEVMAAYIYSLNPETAPKAQPARDDTWGRDGDVSNEEDSGPEEDIELCQ